MPVPASPTMLHLDTTTSASSPVEGTWCEVLDTTTSASSPVEGAWRESHTMAPAVCISNPSNGTHNCRPKWRTCWVRLPTAAYRSTHALAYNPSGPHRRRRKFANLPTSTTSQSRRSIRTGLCLEMGRFG